MTKDPEGSSESRPSAQKRRLHRQTAGERIQEVKFRLRNMTFPTSFKNPEELAKIQVDRLCEAIPERSLIDKNTTWKDFPSWVGIHEDRLASETKQVQQVSDVDSDGDVTTIDAEPMADMEKFFGKKWDVRISELANIEAISTPPFMTITPDHDQLKAAAQLDFLCNSSSKGGIFAESEQTLPSILAMWLVKDKPGMSMVIAPKELCGQWVKQIEDCFKEGHKLRAHHVKSAVLTSAHEILASKADVIVVTHEQVEVAFRDLRELPAKITAYRNDPHNILPKPQRVSAPLHSRLWRNMNMPFKRVILDEAHIVHNRLGKRHTAVKELYAEAFILLSDKIAQSEGHNVSGAIDFLKGHPFESHQTFMEAFSLSNKTLADDDPNTADLDLLPKFLEGIVVKQPDTA